MKRLGTLLDLCIQQFEISRLKALNQPFELICEMGSLSKPESFAVQQTDPTAATRLLQNTCEALWQVSALKAKASVKEDQFRIWEEIANPSVRKLLNLANVFGAENVEIPQVFFSEFDQFSQALLSSALLQLCLMHNDYAAAAKCCEKGACFTKEQFAQINTHVREEDRFSWLSKMLILSTTHNRLDIVGLLLQSEVCIEVVHVCLALAAQYGHEAVAKLLLENGANVNVAAADSLTSLIYAATGGSYGADVAVADIEVIEGSTALMSAAWGGNEAVTRLLLDHGADVAAANKHGSTALFNAAIGGHETVTKLLLDCGADVAVANTEGITALMVAAAGGNEAVTKLLLDHGADVAVADKEGSTALMAAALGGHERVTQLLLDHGADVCATALVLALAMGHVAVAKLLVERGAS